MYGIFVNSDGCVKYARAIVEDRKPIETRSRNMLKDLVGKSHVAIIETGRGKKPMVIGYVDIVFARLKSGEWLSNHRDMTLIPEGSKYDCCGKSKWCYFLANCETCDSYPLPATAIRHGRSWCEF